MKRGAKKQITSDNPELNSSSESDEAIPLIKEKKERVISVPKTLCSNSSQGPTSNPFAALRSQSLGIQPSTVSHQLSKPDEITHREASNRRDEILVEIGKLNTRFVEAVNLAMSRDKYTNFTHLFPQYQDHRESIDKRFGILKEQVQRSGNSSQKRNLKDGQKEIPSPPHTQKTATQTQSEDPGSSNVAFTNRAVESKSNHQTKLDHAHDPTPLFKFESKIDPAAVFKFEADTPQLKSIEPKTELRYSSICPAEASLAFPPAEVLANVPTSTTSPNFSFGSSKASENPKLSIAESKLDPSTETKPDLNFLSCNGVEQASHLQKETPAFRFDAPLEPKPEFKFSPSNETKSTFKFATSADSSIAKPSVFDSSAAAAAGPFKFSFSSEANKPISAFSFNKTADERGPEEDSGDDGESPTLPEEPTNAELVKKGAGEENEETKWESKCKLFRFDSGQWNDLGIGLAKLNASSKDSMRLLIRAEGTGKVLINALTKSLVLDEYKNDRPREIVIATPHDSSKYLLRTKDAIIDLIRNIK